MEMDGKKSKKITRTFIMFLPSHAGEKTAKRQSRKKVSYEEKHVNTEHYSGEIKKASKNIFSALFLTSSAWKNLCRALKKKKKTFLSLGCDVASFFIFLSLQTVIIKPTIE
jgi:hypothetical protein